jgi:DNA-directed RNA polymerase subunit RPC12/RpoP
MNIQLIENQNHFPVPIGFCINWIHFGEKHTYALQCPTCSRAFCLAGHTIDNDGNISPSVVCPFNCGFHVFMKIVKNGTI